MPTTPSKAEQVAEAEARAQGERLRGQSPIPANETADALEAPGDTPADPLEGAPAPQPAPAPAPEPEAKLAQKTSLGDQKRADIMARFRTERPVLGEQDNDEVVAFTKSGGMPAEFRPIEPGEGEPAAEPEPVAAAPAEPAEPTPAADPQQTVKIKVRGEEKEIPLDEVIATARRTYAADDYLDEAKNKLGEVNDLLRQTKDQAARPAPNGQPQAAPNGTHPAEPGQDEPSLQPQESPVKRLIEAIQFGDPAEAETLLLNTIGQVAEATTRKTTADQRINDDRTAAARAIADFSKEHPDVAKDPRARAVMETFVFDLQAEDLTKLGVDLNKIRTDGQPATPADIANYHRALRANGYDVRSPADMLTASHEKYLDWRGIKNPEPAADPTLTPPPPQQQQQRSAAPRVTISVDRQQRRQQPAASPQPSQTQRPAPAPAPRPQDPIEARASVVEQMQQRKLMQRSGSPYVMGAVRRA